ncbi:NUDIX domain-containing protein [Saccharothrix violaceirubra]|uniref:8-oxo-dGTP diphosphatase n=1 Tax=Saccharothrix violaceirubra TaxID=413306 RepID=A0A7W7SZ92_9PSEU|nr:NUDIX domain-containing protein [Saccharothrix violaceirubra]MBB4963699.1 8-oxo-dGTP diphosphatase [Saccharothrix violaceirubra]
MAPRDHEIVRLTADLVILTVRSGRLCVLLVERANEPFRGRPALPGGFLRAGETIEETAARELAEETSLDGLPVEQIGVYSAPDRDPRDPRVVTCAFLAIAPDLPVPVAGTDAREARWLPLDEVGGLAFDHGRILADAVERARTKLQYTTVATAFCPPEFTISELREVYEVVWDVEVDRPNFHRKVTDAEGFVEPTGAKSTKGGGRPAVLYRAGGARVLHPPMVRPRAKSS